MPLKIFILDDEIHSGGLSNRSNLKDILGRHELTLATSCPEAIKVYKPGTYDLLLLDHDMEGWIETRKNHPNTGLQFCKWLVQHETIARPPVLIHSHNPDGKKAMRLLLQDYGFKVEEHYYGRAYERALLDKFGRRCYICDEYNCEACEGTYV